MSILVDDVVETLILCIDWLIVVLQQMQENLGNERLKMASLLYNKNEGYYVHTFYISTSIQKLILRGQRQEQH